MYQTQSSFDSADHPVGDHGIEKASGRVHSFRVQLYSHLCGVDPTSERAIFNHYGRVAVEGRAMTSYDREVALVAEYDVVAGELQQVEVL